MTCPMRCCVSAGSRTPITSTSAARSSSSTGWLAQPHGRGAVAGAAPGKPVGGHQDQGDQAVRAVTGDRRYHGAAQERDVPHRCQAAEPGARETGAAGEAARGGFAPALYAGRQVRSDSAPALWPCQAVQARQPDAEEAADLARPRHSRHQPQDRGRQRTRSGVRPAADAGAARARATAAPARTQGLFPARPGSRMHRQGQGPPALRVRRQGRGGYHPQPRQGRPVRHPCPGAAGQSL